jgi:protein involved in polysaccharide export with SLBB domain
MFSQMSIFPLRIHFLFGALFVASICSDSIFAQANPVAPKNSQPVQATASTTSQPVGTAAATPISAPVQALPATSGSASSLPVLSAEPSGVTGGGAGASGDYILKPGDTIEMVIFHEPDLSIRSRLGKDGMVQLPLLGEVKLAGSTIRSATKMLHDKYNADYIVEPQIYLNIASFNSRKFTIIGQVQRPGTYEFSGGEDLGLLEAIGMAGGFTRIADRGHLIVKRKDGDNVKSLKVNAKKIASDGKDKFLVEPGDVINVGESWY